MPSCLALPIAVTRQGLASVEQDTPEEVAQSVNLLLNTQPGDRRFIPEYGLPDPVFSGATEAEVAEVVKHWEPRADPERLTVINDPGGVAINYSDGEYGAGYYGG